MPKVKLTKIRARTIRKQYARGRTQAELARLWDISQQLVSLIVRRKVWK